MKKFKEYVENKYPKMGMNEKCILVGNELGLSMQMVKNVIYGHKRFSFDNARKVVIWSKGKISLDDLGYVISDLIPVDVT